VGYELDLYLGLEDPQVGNIRATPQNTSVLLLNSYERPRRGP
jgi:hypothetical protein